MNQKELLDLYREFGSKAQEALDFVVKNSPVLKIVDQVPAIDEGGNIFFVDKLQGTERLKDGIYIIFRNGQYKPFDKEDDFNKDDVKYIGVIHDGHHFAVALKDLGSYHLLKDGANCPEKSKFYVRRECDAINDWEYVNRTRHIQKLGTDIPLKEGEYIPSLPILAAMCYWAERGLNEALEFVGGEPLDMEGFYWSCSEGNATYAWYVHFQNGNMSNLNKYGQLVVRAVTAFTYALSA